MLFLKLHGHQNTAAEILWGVWLLPLAVLVHRSRFLPGFLGVAGARRLRLPCLEPYWRTVAAISGHGVYHLPARLPRGNCAHAVARDQGHQAGRGGRRSLISTVVGSPSAKPECLCPRFASELGANPGIAALNYRKSVTLSSHGLRGALVEAAMGTPATNN
jgi:hypothetical protein